MLEFGIPALIEIPADTGLADAVFSRAAANPDDVMLRRRSPGGQWQDVTAGQFSTQVAALAKGLIAAGIDPGDRVALMSATRYEWKNVFIAAILDIWISKSHSMIRRCTPNPGRCRRSSSYLQTMS